MEDFKNMNSMKKMIPIGIKKVVRTYAGRIFGFKEFKEFYEDVRQQMVLKRQKEEEIIPKYELHDRHIANLKIVTNREAFLKLMPTRAVCAEIGVNRGEFSEEILKITEPI